ncbi:MAG TPA: antibiotic biosynthesis monooxygenase [Thermoprotei archaeon]|nr:antibiotic biosynthesis monooxygenase [Thermoprotei archaeon]
MTIAVVNHIQAHDRESYQKIINLFRNRAGLVDKFQGFKEFKLYASEDELKIMVMTIWEDRESFERWRNSEEFRRGHSRARNENINAESKGVIYEVII